MRGFEGKVAIVTGASRGIGFAIARQLAEGGARVVVTARKAEPLAMAADALGTTDSVLAVAGRADDVSHREEVVDRAMEKFGRIDFLVNNVGVNPIQTPLVSLDLGAARKLFESNCLASLAWVQAVHAAWMAAHGGAILNVTSVAGARPAPGIGFYGATKAMLSYLTQQLAVELAPMVRVNAVAPGVVKTDFAAALYEGRESEVSSRYPLRRLGTPADVAAAASFLLSTESSWMTGQIMTVDGGFLLTGGVE